jgi:flagellar hook-associated protein 1
MADLLSILSSAQTSLAAQRGLTATASHNIDNANNPDYARQIASLEAVVPADQVSAGYVGRGATLTTITQARDRFLEAQIPQALGSSARSTAESEALQAFHGLDPGGGSGLGAAISGFYSSLRALAQNPSDSGLRAAALGACRTMAQAFHRTSQQVEGARSGLDAAVTGLAGTINAEASAVASLNAQIKQARSAGGPPNDLLDLRQKHLDKLAELTGATPVPTSDGDTNLMFGGVALVAGSHAGSLLTRPDPANGGHLQILISNPDGSVPMAVSNASLGGTLGGTLSARDGALRRVGESVDQLAFDLAGAVNLAHGYDPVTGTGQLFAVRATATGAAAQLKLDLPDDSAFAPIDPAAPGDAGIIDALVQTESSALAGSPGVQAALSTIVSEFGASSATARAFADQDGALKAQLTQMRDSYSGVSIDDEMITIQTAQRGYEAIAKVIQTADQMMQTLMGLIK